MKVVLSCLLLFLAAVAQALSATGDRLLTIWEDVEDQKLYSKFIGDLESRGYKISHATPKQDNLKLEHLGERNYDHVIFFPVKAKGLGPNLTAKLLLDFMNAGGNIMVALSSTQSIPTALNAALLELDIHLPAERTGLVVDHFSYDASSAADNHDVVLLKTPAQYKPGTKNYFGSDDANAVIAFPRGVGHILGDGPQLTPVLKAPRTAYIYNQKEQSEVVDEVFAAGEQLALVSVGQARNSARFSVVGSAEMLQDQWMGAKVKRPGEKEAVKTSNQEFAKRISGWTFHEIGHLRVNSVEHRSALTPDVANPGIYRVSSDATYTISISEWSWDRWVAFEVPDQDELQLEFSMLSPFHRLELQPQESGSAEEGTYSVTFKVPDQHGVFNFMTNYKRPFLTNLEEKRTVTVRHLAHDEFDASYEIPAAWPYLTSIGVTCGGWLVFVAFWLFNKPQRQADAAKKTQ